MNLRVFVYSLIAAAITAVIAISVLFATVFEKKTSCLPDHESSEKVSLRIALGENARRGEYPYVVSLQHKRLHFCGGALIDFEYVLTAAHCLVNFKVTDIEVVVGTNILPGFIRYLIHKTTLHPDYNNDSLGADIAVIQLKEAVHMVTGKVQGITLPPSPYDRNVDIADLNGRRLEIIGFGATKSGGSPSVNLKKLTSVICHCPYSLRWGGRFCSIGVYFRSGICQGDDGSPVIIENEQILIGIVSTHLGTYCARGSKDVHTSVIYYVDWITSVMREESY